MSPHPDALVTPVTPGVDVFTPAVDLLKALAHPLRLAIVLVLDEAPRCVHELVDRFDEVQPLVSRHLGVLRDADLVTGTRRGREVVYALVDEHVAHIARDAVTHAQEDET